MTFSLSARVPGTYSELVNGTKMVLSAQETLATVPIHRNSQIRDSTFTLRRHACSNRLQTLSELGLRLAKLAEGVGEVLELVVKLFLDLGELLCRQRAEIDCNTPRLAQPFNALQER